MHSLILRVFNLHTYENNWGSREGQRRQIYPVIADSSGQALSKLSAAQLARSSSSCTLCSCARLQHHLLVALWSYRRVVHISVGNRRESLSRAVTSSRLLRLKKRWLTAQLGSFGDFGQQRKQTRRFREEEIQLWICEAVALGWEQWGEEERGGRKKGMKEKKERREGRAQPAAGPCLWCHRMDDRAKCTSRLLAAVFWPKAIEKEKKSLSEWPQRSAPLQRGLTRAGFGAGGSCSSSSSASSLGYRGCAPARSVLWGPWSGRAAPAHVPRCCFPSSWCLWPNRFSPIPAPFCDL